MKDFLSKTYVKRALRTFLQTAVGYIATNIVAINFTDVDVAKSALLGLGVSAIAAGLAAVMNLRDEK